MTIDYRHATLTIVQLLYSLFMYLIICHMTHVNHHITTCVGNVTVTVQNQFILHFNIIYIKKIIVFLV